MRVLITGSRNWTDKRLFYSTLHRHITLAQEWSMGTDSDGVFVDWIPPRDFVLVHGGASDGADMLATDWMVGWDMVPEVHPADWKTHGKSAGFRRNQEIVDLGADLCIGFQMLCVKCVQPGERAKHWSHGTAHTLERAAAAGIDTLTIYGEKP